MKSTVIRIILRSLPLIAFVLMVYVFRTSNELARLSQDVQMANTTIDALQDDNVILTQKIASASSLATISEKASQLGYRTPTKQQYLTIGPQEFSVALGSLR